MLGGEVGDFLVVIGQAVGQQVGQGEVDVDGGHAGGEQGVGEALGADAGDDAIDLPSGEIGGIVGDVAGLDVEGPRAVEAGVLGDAAEQFAAVGGRSFDEQGDVRGMCQRRLRQAVIDAEGGSLAEMSISHTEMFTTGARRGDTAS